MSAKENKLKSDEEMAMDFIIAEMNRKANEELLLAAYLNQN